MEIEIADVDHLDLENMEETRAINMIARMKKSTLRFPGLTENSDNFATVSGTRVPQLRYNIRDFDIISKYCPVSECDEWRIKVEKYLINTVLELNKESVLTIDKSNLVKTKFHGGKKPEQERLKKIHDKIDKQGNTSF